MFFFTFRLANLGPLVLSGRLRVSEALDRAALWLPAVVPRAGGGGGTVLLLRRGAQRSGSLGARRFASRDLRARPGRRGIPLGRPLSAPPATPQLGPVGAWAGLFVPRDPLAPVPRGPPRGECRLSEPDEH